MNVIRHDDRDLEVERLFVVVQTTREHDRSHGSWKNPPPISAKCHKMLPVIDLKMRQLPAIKSLRHEVYVGTAAFGCPRSKAPLVLILGRPRCLVRDFREVGKSGVQFGNFLAGRKGELRSPGQPMAAVPTKSYSVLTLSNAYNLGLPAQVRRYFSWHEGYNWIANNLLK